MAAKKIYQSHKIENHFDKILTNMAFKKAKGMTTYMAHIVVQRLRSEIGKRLYKGGINTQHGILYNQTGDFLRSPKRTATFRDGNQFYAKIFFDSDELTVGQRKRYVNDFSAHKSQYGSYKWGYSVYDKVRAPDLAMWLDQGYHFTLKKGKLEMERPPTYFMYHTFKAKEKLAANLRAGAISDKMLSDLDRVNLDFPENFGGSSYNAFYGLADMDYGSMDTEIAEYDDDDEDY